MLRLPLRGFVSLFISFAVIRPLFAAPVTAPYSFDFGQYPARTENIPNLTTSGSWFVSTAGRYATIPNSPSTAEFQVSNLAGRDFEMSTGFSVSPAGAGGVEMYGGGYALTYNGSLILGGVDTQPVITVNPALSAPFTLRIHRH